MSNRTIFSPPFPANPLEHYPGAQNPLPNPITEAAIGESITSTGEDLPIPQLD